MGDSEVFHLTDKAAQQVQIAARESEAEDMALRIAANRKEDGSIEYLVGFDEARSDDIEVEAGSVKVVFSPEYEVLLRGAEMDYVEITPNDYRFIFLNPNDDHYVPPKIED